MKSRLFAIFLGICLLSSTAQAQEIVSNENTKEQIAELRLNASYHQAFKHHLSLSLEEEIRTCLGGTSPTAFSRSYTTISFSYAPIEYLHLGLGYTVKIYGNKGFSDPNEYIRHRLSAHITGQYKVNRWKFSLRERLLLDCRTDSVNPNEQNKYDLALRHRLQASYSMFGKPLQFHASIEFANTLNSPTNYLNTCATTHYGQYLSHIRPEIGVKWRINKANTLSLSYRFDYGYKRDLNIKRKSGNIELTNEYKYNHLIILAYQFNN